MRETREILLNAALCAAADTQEETTAAINSLMLEVLLDIRDLLLEDRRSIGQPVKFPESPPPPKVKT